jgi:hypothetical protein
MQLSLAEIYTTFLDHPDLHKAFLCKIIPKSKPMKTQKALRKSLNENLWQQNIPLSPSELDEIMALIVDPENLSRLMQNMLNLGNFNAAQLEKHLTYQNLQRCVFPETCLYVLNQREPNNVITRKKFYSML